MFVQYANYTSRFTDVVKEGTNYNAQFTLERHPRNICHRGSYNEVKDLLAVCLQLFTTPRESYAYLRLVRVSQVYRVSIKVTPYNFCIVDIYVRQGRYVIPGGK